MNGFQAPRSEICLCSSTPQSVRRRCPRVACSILRRTFSVRPAVWNLVDLCLYKVDQVDLLKGSRLCRRPLHTPWPGWPKHAYPVP